MPNVERYQDDILARLSNTTSMKVSAEKLQGAWRGFRPTILLENVVFAPAAASKSTVDTGFEPSVEAGAKALLSRESLSVPRLQAGLSWWSLAMGQPRFSNVQVFSPKLSLTRTKDGLIYFAGKAINKPSTETGDERLLEFLLDQPGAEIRNASLTWNDLQLNKTATFTDVNIKIEKVSGKHRFAFSAKPPAPLASLLVAQAELKIAPAGTNNKLRAWTMQGKVFCQLGDINLDEVKQFVALPDQLKTGRGNLRAWVDIDTESPLSRQRGNPISRISADVNIGDTSVQIGDDLAALQIAKLAGRIDYEALDGGFKLGSRNLTFQTKEVTASTPADFSVSMLHQGNVQKASGEFTANAIDLKVVTSLLGYFPVGAPVREAVKRYTPRGVVNKTKFVWTGYLDALKQFAVTGELAQFGINANGKTPGLSGFSGTIDATEKGGKLTIASSKFQLDLPEVFKKPLIFDTVDAATAWTFSDVGLQVDIARFALKNSSLAGDFGGTYRLDNGKAATINSPNKAPGTVDIQGKFSQLELRSVADYLPIGIPDTRNYIERALRSGSIVGGDFSVRGALYDFPFHKGQGGDFKLALKARNAVFKYVEGWPQVDALDADLVFHNTKLGLKIDKAKIFNAEFKNAVIDIEDLQAPDALIKINAVATARAEDTLRFLRESPMAKTVGSFAEFIALEGPGKLTLGLNVPIGSATTSEQLTLNGSYQLEKASGRAYFGGGSATSGLINSANPANPSFSNISGIIAFTHKSVKSTNIVASAFDHPLTVQISGGGESNVITEINGRASVAKLEEVLPFKLPAQVRGTINFATTITPTDTGVSVKLESNLVGLSSSLPAPAQKAESDSRLLKVVLNDAGSTTERIQISIAGANPSAPTIEAILARFKAVEGADATLTGLYGGVLNLSGGTAAGTTAKPAIPRGVYIVGALATLDFDAWRGAIANMYPVLGNTGSSTGTGTNMSNQATNAEASIFTGFDLSTDSLLAFGRTFTDLKLKGRRIDADWRATVESPAISGDVTWQPQAFGDSGFVRARLRNFVLTDVAPTTPNSATVAGATQVATGANDVPALDIVAEKFVWKSYALGKLKLVAAPKDRAWRIDKMNISNGHATLETSGEWKRDASNTAGSNVYGSTTSLKTKLQVKNLNALFAQFNHADDMKGGSGVLDGTLSWPGHVYQYDASRLSGEFKLEALAGRFSKIDPGAGKLLGLMSLQSIPRRFSFDFRDVFNEGFAFDSINGDMKINSGVVTTENFEIEGPAAKVKMVGEVNLNTETQNLTMTVRPAISGVAALAAGLALANPLIGAAILVTQKVLQDPIDNVLATRFSVTGTWAEPITAKIDRQTTAAKSVADAVNPPPAIVK